MLASLAKYKKTKEDVEPRLLTSMLPMHLYMQGHTHIHTAKKKTEKPEKFIKFSPSSPKKE